MAALRAASADEAITMVRVSVSLVLFALVLVGGVLSLVFWSPLLGAVLLVGAMGGLLWAMGPAVVGRIARWLSVGR